MITANLMVRDEPFIFFAIASVAPYIEKVLVFDTGSTDSTIDDIKLAMKYFDNVELHERKLPNAQHWKLGKLDGCEQWPGHSEVGNIRQEMHLISNTKFVLVVDGDEVYQKVTIQDVVKAGENNLGGDNVHGGFLPFIDFYQNFNLIHQKHWMGRLWRKEKILVRGAYPVEMHHSVDYGELHPYKHGTFMINTVPVRHHELLVKPWRKSPKSIESYNGELPEVFTEYPDLFKERLSQWT